MLRGRPRTFWPELQGLERRVAPVGFYQGPPLAPSYISLGGEVAASETIHPARSGGETITLRGGGRVSPLGRTTVVGSLRIADGVERGSLTLQSAQYRLTVNLSGPVPSAASGVTVLHEAVFGRGPVPYVSTEMFTNEVGGGSVEVMTGVGAGRVPVTLVFLD